MIINPSTLQSLEVSGKPKRATKRYSVIGGIAGAVLGGLVGSTARSETKSGQGGPNDSTFGAFNFFVPEVNILGGALLGGMAGYGIGYIIGSVSYIDDWENVEFASGVPRYIGHLGVGHDRIVLELCAIIP